MCTVSNGSGVTGDVYGSDGSPFVIDSISVTPQTAVTVNDKVTVRIKANDDQSSITWMTAFFSDPKGSFYGRYVSCIFDATSGDWVGTIMWDPMICLGNGHLTMF